MGEYGWSEIQEQRLSSVESEIEKAYRAYINPSAKDVVIRLEDWNFQNSIFRIYENKELKDTCYIASWIFKDILRGNKEPKVSSSFFGSYKVAKEAALRREYGM